MGFYVGYFEKMGKTVFNPFPAFLTIQIVFSS
jgi:hypothetical protein